MVVTPHVDVKVPDIPNGGVVTQVISTLIISLVCLSGGMATGWASPMSLILKSEQSPVGVMDNEGISLLVTLPGYAGILLTFFLGYIVNQCGRKCGLIWIGIPSIVSGIMLTFASSSTMLYIGRIMASFSIVGAIPFPLMYVSEILHESIRGSLMTFCVVQVNIGVLISYTAGTTFSYRAYNSTMIAIPTIYTFLLLWLPESPYYLIANKRVKDAKSSLIWYRGGDIKIAREEILRMKLTSSRDQLSIREAFKLKGTVHAFKISLVANLLQSLSGVHILVNYSGIIFEESGSSFGSAASSLVTAILMVVSSVLSLTMIDRVGRKRFLIVSFAGCSLSLSTLSMFLLAKSQGYNTQNLGWIPITCIGFFVIMYGLGVGSVPGMLMSEVCAPNVKPAITVIVGTVNVTVIVAFLQAFPFIDKYFGLYTFFIFPSVFNFLGIIFTCMMVPETAGKSLSEIALTLSAEDETNAEDNLPV